MLYQDENWHCCEKSFSLTKNKLAFIIENYYQLDVDKRCNLCHAPCLSNSLSGLSDRCLHYPSCSVQTDLFGAQQEKEAYVFFDFETTGLEVGTDRVIEFGAMKVDKDGTESFFQALVNPKIDIPKHITKITGISTAMVSKSSYIEDVLPDFLSFIKDAILVAHHAEFDVGWLLDACRKQQLSISDNTGVICTLNWAKKLKESRCSLGILSKKYNITNQSAHRALADAIATKHLFFEFKKNTSTTVPRKTISDYNVKNQVTSTSF